MTSYCETARENSIFKYHHDELHGRPVRSDNILFEYYCLEIAQAGLSWQTIMKKHQGMKAAFDGFDVVCVAAYKDADIARLMVNKDVIKYRLKITSIIHNAQKILELRKEYGGLAEWLDKIHGEVCAELKTQKHLNREDKKTFAKKYWLQAIKKQFKFAGMEIVGEFLMGVAYLPDAHIDSCPIFQHIKAKHGALPFEDWL